MRINRSSSAATLLTHEGAPARRITPELELRRAVMACLLWEDSFYESGESIADRIVSLIGKVAPKVVADIAYEARTKMKLRHVPLLIARTLANGAKEQRLFVADLLEHIIQRPDELTEFLAIYWKGKRQPLAAQVKKGLARAFVKFNAYSLAKYNRQDGVKLRDVLFLTHAKPKTEEQAAIWKQLVDGTLAAPDTWEVALSAGANKKETFERLIGEKNLGALALLRNLRNMEQAGCNEALVREAIVGMKTERVLPFRFISAAKYAPRFEAELEQAMFRCLEGHPKLKGKTALLIDGSGSMFGPKISAKSELDRFDAACALAMLIREVCDSVEVICFSGSPHTVPARRGFGLRDALRKAAEQGGTNTENAKQSADRLGYDRIIIVTDEQSHQALSNPVTSGYVVNVASYQNGIGYGAWTHIDGWSEAIVNYILSAEGVEADSGEQEN
jgi:60 kDa SS-A/Ro ribonucleoprotein